jgi:hypothetical protein
VISTSSWITTRTLTIFRRRTLRRWETSLSGPNCQRYLSWRWKPR